MFAVRYSYAHEAASAYVTLLHASFTVHSNFPLLTGIVRDPNDDVVLACAVAADAQYVVTRDKDLLSLVHYQDITMIGPEALLALLRSLAH